MTSCWIGTNQTFARNSNIRNAAQNLCQLALFFRKNDQLLERNDLAKHLSNTNQNSDILDFFLELFDQ